MSKETMLDAEKRMKGALQSLKDDLATIRTGRASPALLERLQVEYYGVPTPMLQVATISAPDARTLQVRPFDAGALKPIEKAILSSDLGLTPNNDGKAIRLNIPPLTEERRKQLTVVVKKRVEEAKVALRNIRHDTLKALQQEKEDKKITEDDLNRAKTDLQKLTDNMIAEGDQIGKSKETEIMTV